MSTINTFKKAIGAANSGQKFPALSLVRNDPELAAVMSKLIPAREAPQYGSDGNRAPHVPNMHVFQNLSEHTAQNISDAKTVMQLLPDMELAAQILISSIIAPKDMTTTEITYGVADGLLAPDVSTAMIARVQQHLEQVYRIKPLLPKMLRDILFETGSYAVAVIPENTIDDVINSDRRISLEALSEHIDRDGSVKPLGLLGPAVKNRPSPERVAPGLALEGLNDGPSRENVNGRIRFETSLPSPVDDSFLTVTDNPSLLKIPKINQKLREQRILSAVGSKAMESFSTKMNDREMTNLVYKDRQFSYKPISVLKTQEQLNRRTVGNPLILHLPSESVIPVYVPGCVEEQIGFFVLIDADGNPVSKADDIDHYQQLSSRLNSNGSFPSAMLQKVKGMMNGFDINNREHMDFSAKTYGNMVEQDLLARLRNGLYGNGVAIAKKDEVYRIMFSRALAKQHTQLLFLPVELMTYMAIRHDSDGIGKSLLDDMKILNSLRSMLLFANVMSSLKNSIGRTEVKLKLDENDPNPQKTIELAMHEIVRSRQQYFPLGTNSPTDLVDWLGRAGYEFTFEGHPGIPDVAVDFGEKASNYVKPDTELEESLRKRAIMATGLSPETVDATFQAEFATSVVANNLLLSKRVIQIQEQYMPQLTDHIRKYIMNSEELINDLREILENNFDKLKVEKKDQAMAEAQAQAMTEADKKLEQVNDKVVKRTIVNQYLQQFFMNFEVSLPKPNSITLENQLTALETYTKALDATLDAYLSDRFFTPEMGGDVANTVSTVKEVLKAYFIRQWMAENGVMTELSVLTTVDENDQPVVDIFDIQSKHLGNLSKSLTHFMASLQPVKEAADTVLQERVGEVEPASSFSSDTGGDDFGGGSDFDLGGGGDDPLASLDEAIGGGDETSPTDTETPTEQSEGGDKPATDDAGSTDKADDETSTDKPAGDEPKAE